MFRPLEVFIGLRYTRAKRRNHFDTFISLVSILGIAVGVTALITVISVMNGFDKELKDRILGMVAHATVSGIDESVRDWPHALERAEANPHVQGAAPYVEREAMLQGERVAGAIVRGVLPALEPRVSEVDRRMVQGSLDDLAKGRFKIVLGRELAMQLGVGVGDAVTVITPEVSSSPAGVQPRFKRFHVSGIFEIGMQEYDGGLAIMHMEDAQTLYRLDGPTGIRLKLDDLFRAYAVARDVSGELGQAYRVTDWMQGHSNFFKAIAMEKKVMFDPFADRRGGRVQPRLDPGHAGHRQAGRYRDPAHARTDPGQRHGRVHGPGRAGRCARHRAGRGLRRAARAQSEAIVKWVETTFGISFLSPDVYYISELPSDLHWGDVGWITVTAFVFCVFATLYPAWRAARIEPAAALRHE